MKDGKLVKEIIGQLMYGKEPYFFTMHVNPSDMMTLLQRPFKEWFSSIGTWTNSKNNLPSINHEDFRLDVFETISYLEDHDLLFDPETFEWCGFRFDLNEDESATELVFTEHCIAAETHIKYEKISENLYTAIKTARRILNQIQTPTG